MNRVALLPTLVVAIAVAVGASGLAADSQPRSASPDAPGADAVICEAAKPYEGPAPGESIDAEIWRAAHGSLAGSLPAERAAALQASLDAVLEKTGLNQYSVALGVPGQGLWQRAQPAGTDEQPSWFYWASVGKLFTAVAVLQAVEREAIALDDPLSRWFPEFPNAASITVDHLLTHTNGTFSFNEDKKFRKLQGYKHPDQLVELAATHGSRFCPGQGWAYSNTGYLLLAQILEKIEGKPYHVVIRERLLKPLGSERIRPLEPQEIPPGLVTPPGNRHGDLETFDYSTPLGAGSIVAEAGEMVRFLSALVSGKLLQQESLGQMLADLYPMFDGPTWYGRGIMVYDVPDPGGGQHRWIGHSGGTPGYKALLAFDLQSESFAAVSIPADLPAEALAHALFRAWADSAAVAATEGDKNAESR